MGARQAMKRIPLIKFPQRHPNPSGAAPKQISVNDDAAFKSEDISQIFSRSQSSMSVGGKACDQPKRTPVTQEEIDAVMLGGCI